MPTTPKTARTIDKILPDDIMKMILQVHTREVLSLSDADYAVWREEFGLMVAGFKNTASVHDELLRTMREVHGADYRKGSDFRAPVVRTKKEPEAVEVNIDDIFKVKK